MTLHQGVHSSSSPTQTPGRGSTTATDEVAILAGRPRLVESSASSAAGTSDPPSTSLRHPLQVPPVIPSVPPIPSESYQPMNYTASPTQWTGVSGTAERYYPTSLPSPTAWAHPHVPLPEYQPNVTTAPTVNFSLEETWSNFLQQYGRIP